MKTLVPPHFFQATGIDPLLIDKQSIARGIPIITSVPFGDARTGDVLTLLFGDSVLGEPLTIDDVDLAVYDISVSVGAWPAKEANVVIQLTRDGQVAGASPPVALKVLEAPAPGGGEQRYEGFLCGTYPAGLVDAWIVASPHQLQITPLAFSAPPVGTNTDNTNLSLKQLKPQPVGDELLGKFVFSGGSWTYLPSASAELVLGDQLGLFLDGQSSVQLALEYSI